MSDLVSDLTKDGHMAEKPLRELMPEWSAFVDAFRENGMTDNKTIGKGLKDGRCWARENGQYVGIEGAPEASEALSARAVKASQMVLECDIAKEREIRGRNKRGAK